jgi:predicted component of type VI protein secretion system
VETALEYQRRIEAHTRKQGAGVLRDRLEDTAAQLANWVSNIYKLALRLDAYRHDPLLTQERETAPKELDTLVSRQEIEKNPAVRQQLNEVIESKRKQWDALQALDARMKQAELQMEQSLTALATIYSQVQLVDAQDIESGRSERLREDIQEQVERLNDLVASINEVYDYHGFTPDVG